MGRPYGYSLWHATHKLIRVKSQISDIRDSSVIACKVLPFQHGTSLFLWEFLLCFSDWLPELFPGQKQDLKENSGPVLESLSPERANLDKAPQIFLEASIFLLTLVFKLNIFGAVPVRDLSNNPRDRPG